MILTIENLLRTANAHPETKRRIERNLDDMELEELERLLSWVSFNQINLVDEGKAKQEEITKHIRTICGL